jgi:hypothetical protein
MRRAVLALLLLALSPLAARAAKPGGPVDGVGMLGYSFRPDIRIGDWVRYRTHGNSAQGYMTDYTVTILIAGEELWWGEECFWVETQTRYRDNPYEEVTASLVSYAVFEDSLPARHFQMYMRKMCEGVGDDGLLVQQPFLRSPGEFVARNFEVYEPGRKVDTLGVKPVEVPKGTFDGLHIRQNYREAITQQEGDSTVYFERNEDHDYYYSRAIPLTCLLRIDQENTQRRRVWLAGESENAPLRIDEYSKGVTELIDFGSGMRTTYLPASLQRPLREQLRANQANRPAAPRRAQKRTGG